MFFMLCVQHSLPRSLQRTIVGRASGLTLPVHYSIYQCCAALATRVSVDRDTFEHSASCSFCECSFRLLASRKPYVTTNLPGQIVQQMYLLATVLGMLLMGSLLTQSASVLALMGAGPKTALFPEASAYLTVSNIKLSQSRKTKLCGGVLPWRYCCRRCLPGWSRSLILASVGEFQRAGQGNACVFVYSLGCARP